MFFFLATQRIPGILPIHSKTEKHFIAVVINTVEDINI